MERQDSSILTGKQMAILLNVCYACLLACLLICATIPRLRWHDVLDGFWQKLWGRLPTLSVGRPVIWVHAASTGEALVCHAVLARLRELRPDVQFAISVTTAEGVAVCRSVFPDDAVFFAPYDFTWSMNRIFRAISPQLLLISENDFWPNMMCLAQRRNIPITIFNTRISRREQIEHRYDGWILLPGLRGVNWWGVVSQQDAAWIHRLFGIGSPPVEVTGSLKCDGILRDRDNPRTQTIRGWLGFSPTDRILVAGSTHSPEEKEVVKIVADLAPEWPDLRLVLVPRDATRFESVAQLLVNQGVPFMQMSRMTQACSSSCLVTLADSIGQLRDIWGLAEFGFVGGSLAEHGGQNMVEPASYGVPICFGPHTWNFRSVTDAYVSANAAIQIGGYAELSQSIRQWLEDPETTKHMGERARILAGQKSTAVEVTARAVVSLLA
jgi:3-deoxy-D-manno-octulosonic-acid transferase